MVPRRSAPDPLELMAELMSPAKFFSEACAHSASFSALQAEHIGANGELLPHVLMADLLRFVGMGVSGEQTLGVPPPSEGETRDLTALVELGLSIGDPELKNVLEVSFVEDIDREPFFSALRPFLGPSVLSEVSRQQHLRDAL